VPSLARLLLGSRLSHLEVASTSQASFYAPLCDARAAALLGGALRENSTLTSLSLC
jgi:hypothetical protein